MRKNKDRLIFVAVGLLIMVLFNIRYCQEVQTAERAKFNGWVGSLSIKSLPEDLRIEYGFPGGSKVVTAADGEAKARALRLVQVLKEAGVVGRLGGAGSDRRVVVRVGDQTGQSTEYNAQFSEDEVRRSPQLQVFARLVSEFGTEVAGTAPVSAAQVASGPDSR
jgi:hypothetical protein